MTSSLVGSEMCIRDRHSSAPPLPRATNQITSPPLLTQHPPRPASTPLTVSYTHLTLPTICSV
eukprot:1315153-Prorocentrum_lima.AAC.1